MAPRHPGIDNPSSKQERIPHEQTTVHGSTTTPFWGDVVGNIRFIVGFALSLPRHTCFFNIRPFHASSSGMDDFALDAHPTRFFDALQCC